MYTAGLCCKESTFDKQFELVDDCLGSHLCLLCKQTNRDRSFDRGLFPEQVDGGGEDTPPHQTPNLGMIAVVIPQILFAGAILPVDGLARVIARAAVITYWGSEYYAGKIIDDLLVMGTSVGSPVLYQLVS